MADNVVLSVSQRQSILELMRLGAQRDHSSRALSTGQSVSSISDNPRDYLRASALSSQASDLLSAKSDIGLAIDSLATAQVGLDAAQRMTSQLQGLAESARTATASQRTEIAAQFDVVRQQLDLLVADASFQGVSLLDNPAGSFGVDLNGTSGNDLNVSGNATDSASLGVGAASTYNSFATNTDIDNALSAIEGATASIRSTASGFTTDAAILNVRQDYNQQAANVLEQGAAALTEADLSAEAARLLTIQTRSSLAQQSMAITAQGQSQIASLIGG